MKMNSVKIQAFKNKFSKIELIDQSAQKYIKGGGDPPPFGVFSDPPKGGCSCCTKCGGCHGGT